MSNELTPKKLYMDYIENEFNKTAKIFLDEPAELSILNLSSKIFVLSIRGVQMMTIKLKRHNRKTMAPEFTFKPELITDTKLNDNTVALAVHLFMVELKKAAKIWTNGV